ncbi:MAG: methylmalonyl Co-A mutase-associated GTPase MeaB [Candidatus Kapabacteria bacterium]|nr:methylmalonyl Co-A mutase-associated GTPase MeaB [Candidatus Kapabacteria bacterium]
MNNNTDLDNLISKIQTGDITSLSKAITLVESSKSNHQALALNLLSKLSPNKNKTFRIGISGSPGVGKSTFIDTFGEMLCSLGHKVAVLAVDPSSEISKGAILGDKTRMENLSKNPRAFIRPSASGGTLGGVAKRTRETVTLCETAGFDVMLIETVGVGQSEIVVKSLVDFFLLLVQSGSGDELQGIKKGIVEIADTLVVTKDDGTNQNIVRITKAEYENALHYLSPINDFWFPKVLTCSAIDNIGLDNIWGNIKEFYLKAENEHYIFQNRKKQEVVWYQNNIFEEVKNMLLKNPKFKSMFNKYSIEIAENKTNSSIAYEKSKEILKSILG